MLTATSNETFFSSGSFINSISRAMGDGYHALAVPIGSSATERFMWAAQSVQPYTLRRIWLAPFGLPASPGWDGRLDSAVLQSVVSQLTSPRTVSIVWNIRFDHLEVAEGLQRLGFVAAKPVSTHILRLGTGHDCIFAGYNATIRNQIRKAQRAEVRVREACDAADLAAYYHIHTSLASQKGGYGQLYPIKLFQELLRDRQAVRLLIAEYQGKVVSGGLFFVDGRSVMYWHGASDRGYSHVFPSFAVINEAIRWAIASGATFFNFGNSNGMASLEQFKSFWGAQQEWNRVCVWRHPVWKCLGNAKRILGRAFGAGRVGDNRQTTSANFPNGR